MFDGYEALLALIFFVVLPLLNQWRERQRKTQVPPPPRRSAPVPTGPAQEVDEVGEFDEGAFDNQPVWAPAPPAPVPPRARVPPPVHRVPHVVTRPVRPARPIPTWEPVVAPRAARVHRRQSRGAFAGLAGRADLRQAIVQMTILGPCRAQQPYGTDG